MLITLIIPRTTEGRLIIVESKRISQRTLIMTARSSIHPAQPRDTVRVTFPDGMILEGAVGTTIQAFLQAAEAQRSVPFSSLAAGGIFDGRLRELRYPIERDGNLEAVLLSDQDGRRIYRRSLVLLLTTAVDELFGVKVTVNYAVPGGGFYCATPDRAPFSAAELAQIDAHMRQIVDADEPIDKRVVPLDEAVALFSERGDADKVRLLEQRTRDQLTLYTLRGRSDYYFGYMMPSTGCLGIFRLTSAEHGFILQYPTADNGMTLPPLPQHGKIEVVFAQADAWLDRVGIEDVGRLNRLTREDNLQELILIAEAFHEQQIAQIAAEIDAHHYADDLRLVLIAGPSSSGKTTFSKRLAIQVLARGLRPFTLEMDNYFVDRERTPKDENGDYDFEALDAINLPLFNMHLAALIRGETVMLPRFDFITGKSGAGSAALLQPRQIIIIEGIHGLNPSLITHVDPQRVYRIYISALTQLNIDAHNRVPTTDVRLIRRIARDASARGYSAAETIARWESVRRGERRDIFSYQEYADAMFNSALVYELAALRPLVEPLLLQVEVGTREHIEANRLLSFLRWVQPMNARQLGMIPDTSLLREFIGGSILRDYHPGRHETRANRK
jgi:uridine kinase